MLGGQKVDNWKCHQKNMGVSKNNGTPPKSSTIFSIGFSMKQKTIQFWGAFFKFSEPSSYPQFLYDPKTRGNSVAEAFGVAFFFVSFIIAMLTCLTTLALWWWNGLSSWRFLESRIFRWKTWILSSVFPTHFTWFLHHPNCGVGLPISEASISIPSQSLRVSFPWKVTETIRNPNRKGEGLPTIMALLNVGKFGEVKMRKWDTTKSWPANLELSDQLNRIILKQTLPPPANREKQQFSSCFLIKAQVFVEKFRRIMKH